MLMNFYSSGNKFAGQLVILHFEFVSSFKVVFFYLPASAERIKKSSALPASQR